MLKGGILNPAVNCLLSRVRHTNTLVISDRGFPFWPTIETVDISLVDNIPTVLDVLAAIRPNFVIGQAWMAEVLAKTVLLRGRARAFDGLDGTAEAIAVDTMGRTSSTPGLSAFLGDAPLATMITAEPADGRR